MNYLYTEKTISNPVDSILLLPEHIVVHHHSTIKIYDLSFNFLDEKYFTDKIITIQKINSTTIVILFDSGKVVQCNLCFSPVCLRILEGTGLSCYNLQCVVYNSIKAQTFSAFDEEVKDLYYFKFGIYNIKAVFFAISYIPTLFIAWKTNDVCKCSLINLDGVPTKIDEYEILGDSSYFKALDKFMVFATRNCLQIKFKREMAIVILNKNLGAADLPPAFSSSVIEASNDGSYESQNAFLENPQIFMKKDNVFILNGNGELFRLSLKVDARKITKIHISYIGRHSQPTCLDFNDHYMVVGSLKDDTVIYSYNAGDDSVPEVVEFARNSCIGQICDFSATKDSVLSLLTNKGLYSVRDAIDFDAYEKVKIDSKPFSSKMLNAEILVLDFGDKKEYFKLGSDSIVKEGDSRIGISGEFDKKNAKFSDCEMLEHSGFQIVSYKNKVLEVHRGGSVLSSFSDVESFSLSDSFLAVVTLSQLIVFSLERLSTVFTSTSIHSFANCILNDEANINSKLNTLSYSTLDQHILPEFKGTTSSKEADLDNKIVEILIRKENFLYLFFRTETQLYLYKLAGSSLLKIFIPKLVIFSGTSKSLFNLSKFIYCRSKIPYCIFLNNGIFVYKCNIRFNHPIDRNGWIYATHKGCLIKLQSKQLTESYLLSSNFLIKNETAFVLDDCKPLKNSEFSNEKSLFEDYRYEPIPKFIIARDDFIIVSYAKHCPFKFIPFIPMMHISDGPDGKPHSEPINKEEAEYVNPYREILGRTLRYFVNLYSIDYKLMSSFQMEENEIICDLKLILKNFLVVCTSFPEGEDKFVKGRVLVYSLVDIVPDPLYPHLYKKLKLISSESFKNSCLFCEEVRGLLALCIGTRLMIYELNINTGLTAVGRNEIALLSTSLFVCKNMIAVSDIFEGIYFFFLRPRDPLKLHLLGRSFHLKNIRSIQGLTYSSGISLTDHLSLLAYDKSGCIYIYTFSPYHPASNGGSKLIKRAAINTKLRYPLWLSKCHQFDPNLSIFISSNIIIAVKTIEVKRIQALHSCISNIIDNSCGINPKNYLEPEDYSNKECKSVISERILLEFFYLSPLLQQKISTLLNINYATIVKAIETCLQDQ